MRWCTYSLIYLVTRVARENKSGTIPETVEDRAKVTINGLYKVMYTGFRLPPKCVTLSDLCARFKVIDSLNAAKMAKYILIMTPTPCRVISLR